MSLQTSFLDKIIDTILEYDPNKINTISDALSIRNKSWKNNSYIPNWIDVENVGLDQFFTIPSVAKDCLNSLYEHIKADKRNIEDYKFIEPSAGLGAFYNLLPKKKRIGIDVMQFSPEYIRSDFLSWEPKKKTTKYICVGNPPFGYRAWLALAFLNHASLFSDYVGFIVPMAFQSRGKSNVQDRVKGLNLVHSVRLPQDSFANAQGKILKVNALWQIWSRNSSGSSLKIKTCDQFIDLFTVDMRKERLCGQKRLHEADFFLQRTFYTEPPTLVDSFNEVKYVCGYGIVIKRDKKEIVKALRNADWKKHSNLASHNCRHISMCHIREALIEAGFIDE